MAFKGWIWKIIGKIRYIFDNLSNYNIIKELTIVYQIYGNPEIIDTVFANNFFEDIKYNFSEKRKQVIKNAFEFITNG